MAIVCIHSLTFSRGSRRMFVAMKHFLVLNDKSVTITMYITSSLSVTISDVGAEQNSESISLQCHDASCFSYSQTP